MSTKPIVLASASPRRRVLLEQVGLEFEVAPVPVDEILAEFQGGRSAAEELAQRKARASAELRQGREQWVIGSDTVVAVRPFEATSAGSNELGSGAAQAAKSDSTELDQLTELLGKPEDPAQAARMLSQISSSRHAVVTGVCVVRCSDGQAFLDSETTWVSMRRIDPAEIEAYVASGEWRDKAGGYAIQESADQFVTGLEGGGFDNVVGLPVELTLDLLRKSGAPLPPDLGQA